MEASRPNETNGREEARIHSGRHPRLALPAANRCGREPRGGPRGRSADLSRAFRHLPAWRPAAGMSIAIRTPSDEQAAAAHARPDAALLIAARRPTRTTCTATAPLRRLAEPAE